MSNDLNDLYQAVILDHSKRPRNHGKPPHADRAATGDNPTCGDNCTVYLHMSNDAEPRVDEIGFDGSGCAISQASASVMTTQFKGKTKKEAEILFEKFKNIINTGKMPAEFSEISAFAGVHAFPARVKCATLAWHAALDAMNKPPMSEDGGHACGCGCGGHH